nr:hypothetical protein [Tanacetum cinerariifolium]
MVNTVRVKDTTARERAVVSEYMGIEANAVKASAVKDTTARERALGNSQQKEYKEKEVIDSGCSRHMTGNICYLSDYEDYDGGFFSFGEDKGRISSKDLTFWNLVLKNDGIQVSVVGLTYYCVLVMNRDMLYNYSRRVNAIVLDTAYTYCCQMKVNAAKHKLPTAGDGFYCWEKPTESDGFKQIVDFLNANPIKYESTVSPTIYTLCIKQFWTSAKVKTINDDVRLQALVDGKKVIVNEAFIKRDLRLDDAEGTACLPNNAIFKGSIGAKSTAWNEFSSAMASRKHKPRRKQREETKFPHTEPQAEERVPTLPMIHYPMEDASKQGRIAEMYYNEDLFLIDETAQYQRRIKDHDLFEVHDLEGDEVFVDVTTGEDVEQDPIVAESVEDLFLIDETAQYQRRIKDHDLFEVHDLEGDEMLQLAKDKGKGIMVELEKTLKKKDQIALDEEMAKKLEAEIKAKMDKEERIAREKNKANKAIIEEWDDVHATIDADRECGGKPKENSSRNVRLQVDYELEMTYDLLRLIRRQINEGYKQE